MLATVLRNTVCGGHKTHLLQVGQSSINAKAQRILPRTYPLKKKLRTLRVWEVHEDEGGPLRAG